MDWNPSQKKAIETRGKNILVSAAAGSGKTAVLVERIRRLVMEDRVAVNRFLVVTFTDAAASEMRAKLEKALKDEALTAEGERLRYIKDQLEALPDANISTFHSFALEIVRRYFYCTGLSPEMTVADETESRLLKQKAAEAVFERGYREEREDFLDFVLTYGGDRKDDGARELVTGIYDKIMSIPDPFAWLEEHTEALNGDEETFRSGPLMKAVMEDSREAVGDLLRGEELIGNILCAAGAEKLGGKFLDRLEKLKQQDIGHMSYERMAEFISGFSNIPLRPSKEEKEAYQTVKEGVLDIRHRAGAKYKKVREQYFTMKLSEYVADMNAVYPRALCLQSLIGDFRDEYRRLKEERGLLDYSDIEHYALEILAVEPRVGEEYREKFRYILIDEYQDSNEVQEALISHVAGRDNLFMVGDVKQSIYSFRLAEPAIFLRRYEQYGNDPDSVRIDLNENYRSKQGVIDAVNDVFMGRMVGYDQNSRLNKGIVYQGPLEHNTELVLIETDIKEGEEIDDEIADMKKAELEARTAAGLIREALTLDIYDVKAERVRKVTYRDIVIISRSIKDKAGIFARILGEEGIPVYVDDREGYFNTLEISTMENLLRLIDNPKQDVPLITVLHSPLFAFDADDLIEIRRMTPKGEYYRAFRDYAREGTDGALAERCRNVNSALDTWRHLSMNLDISDLIWEIMWDTGYYTYAGALADGLRRQANLRLLCEKAAELSRQGTGDLKGFIDWIDAIRGKRAITVGQMNTASPDEDTVRMMSVHKSKGLEFPVVIAPGQGSRFNNKRDSYLFSFNSELGYGLARIERKKHWKRKTIIESVIDSRNLRKKEEEEKRTLYVQYTRAVDKLYLLGTVKEFSPAGYTGAFSSLGAAPLEYIRPAVGKSIRLRETNLREMSAEKASRTLNKERVRELLSSAECTDEDIEARLSWRYPHKDSRDTRSKVSVTDIYSDGRRETSLKTPAFMNGERKFSPAEEGILTHRLLEYADYGAGDAASQLRDLTARNIFTEGEAGAVNAENADRFLRSDLAARAAASEDLRREQPFTMMSDIEGHRVMVQGVIDCCFLEDGGYVIIDFKNTDKSNDADIIAAYSGQLSLYEEAVEKSLGKKVREKYIYLIKQGRALRL